ncbi:MULTISPECIES: c-type cytochrome [unclassified Rhizobium]|uniref:c-type cytochrome n=1 Tax=unclassified Rhizobium TaxID=2613769 RepID=UPI001ADC1B4A|nr:MULTISPECIES: cytochrome c [unclassified Rhizobium]MBO9123719.1 cytochrome c [Rhizobium sp. 16-488-2b]MBO9174251.1 cytochrome c [Rhizobium sp. 16-488-2a]
MANWKKIGGGIAVIAVVAAAGAGWWAWNSLNTMASAVADDTTPLAEFKSTDAEAIKRGEYVMRLGDCAACHTRESGSFAGGYEIKTPFGTLISSNITPDAQTGIGNMTERDFFNAVRQGMGQHGMLYPAMPFTAYRKYTDQDMHDLWAYMSTVAPVKNDIDENAGMNFPFNIRLAMAGWDMLFFDNTGFTADGGKDEAWNRGKYIVDGGGHCAACHTPRNALGAEMSSAYLQGGNIGEWFAPDLTPNPHVGLGSSSAQDIANYLKTGSDGTAVAAGPMAEAVEHSTQYFTDADALAIGTYLKSLPASPAKAAVAMPTGTPAMVKAALAYEVNCSACHGLEGEGIEGMVPAFKSNHGLLADDATSLIHAMLRGARAAHTHDRQTAAGMPAFDWKMDDRQVADVLNYVRNSWGNAAAPVEQGEVARLREFLGANEKMQTPH